MQGVRESECRVCGRAIAIADQIYAGLETEALALGHQVGDLRDLGARVVREVEVTARVRLTP